MSTPEQPASPLGPLPSGLSGPVNDRELFEPTHYTPGRTGRKLLMVLVGLALFAAGLTELWTPLGLLFTGAPTTAEATRIVKTKEGLPEQILTDPVQAKAAEETRDRGWIFWNEFRFTPEGGEEMVVRAPIGGQLKPLYPLLDADGLPTTLPIRYDRQNPRRFIFPGTISTWFVPGTLAFLGLLCAGIGTMLFHWSRKPILLPQIGVAENTATWRPPGA